MDLFEYAETVAQTEKAEENLETIFSVSGLTTEIKQAIRDRFEAVSPIKVRGEISNYRGKNQSGHMYFRLKDDMAILSCVFFRGANSKLNFDLKEGTEVVATGRIDLWDKGGSYQLIIERLELAGQGDLYAKFEKLKLKLEAEGLFDPSKKKSIPTRVHTVGVITSATGAVIRDIVHVIEHRFPYMQIILHPVKVQGDGAKDEICAAIAKFEKLSPRPDVLIVGRGGGSIEDLWAFNEECVARSIFTCSIPVISAVGHQTDFTISDFVSDARAATPSHAAEMITSDIEELYETALGYMEQIGFTLQAKLNHLKAKLVSLTRTGPLASPKRLYESKIQTLDYLVEKMIFLSRRQTEKKSQLLLSHRHFLGSRLTQVMPYFKNLWTVPNSKLVAMDPKAVLSRGYAMVKTQKGAVVSDAQDLVKGDEVKIELAKGALECQVQKVFSS